jgi:hypothetical protein
MNTVGSWLIHFLGLIVLVGLVQAQELDCSFTNNFLLHDGLLLLQQVTNPVDETLRMALTYSGIGYIAIGFPSNGGNMIGSTAVIGIPDSTLEIGTPQLYSLASKSQGGVVPLDDAQQILSDDSSIVQNSTHTSLSFTLPLSAFDHTLDGTHTFLYAFGFDNVLDVHRGRGSFSLTLSPCRSVTDDLSDSPNAPPPAIPLDSESGVPNRRMWQAHGFLMAFSWGFIVSIAVGASLLRRLFNISENGFWFVLHRAGMGLTLLCTLIGFLLAAIASSDSGLPHFSNEVPHRTVGLFTFIFLVLQVLVALCRPKLHRSKEHTMMTDEETIELHHFNDNGFDDVEKSSCRVVFEIGHRGVALALLCAACSNVDSGIDLYATRFALENSSLKIIFWGIVGSLTALIAVLYLYQAFTRPRM